MRTGNIFVNYNAILYRTQKVRFLLLVLLFLFVQSGQLFRAH